MGAMHDPCAFGPDDGAGIGGCSDDCVRLQDRIAWQAKDVVDAIGLAPGHDLGPGIMAVAAQGDPGVRPVQADMPDPLCGRRPSGEVFSLALQEPRQGRHRELAAKAAGRQQVHRIERRFGARLERGRDMA